MQNKFNNGFNPIDEKSLIDNLGNNYQSLIYKNFDTMEKVKNQIYAALGANGSIISEGILMTFLSFFKQFRPCCYIS